jgi:hypothetical protein
VRPLANGVACPIAGSVHRIASCAFAHSQVGTLYRAKGVVAQLGSTSRLVFHAVSDWNETTEIGPWTSDSQPGFRMVFIGKQLNRNWFQEGCEACLRPIFHPILPPGPLTSADAPRATEALCANASGYAAHLQTFGRLGLASAPLLVRILDKSPTLFYQLVSPLLSAELVFLAQTCVRLAQALLSESGSEQLLLISQATLRHNQV